MAGPGKGAGSCYSAPKICSLKPMAAVVPEITMPKVSLSGMSVEALMDLRDRVDGLLSERRAELEKQLERMVGCRRVVRGGGSPLWKEGPSEVSQPFRRNLGRSWG